MDDLAFVCLWGAWQYGWAPLHFATDKGHSEVVRVLLHGGMLDVNRRTKVQLPSHGDEGVPTYSTHLFTQGGETALFMACAWGHGSLVQLLLSDPRTDVNIPKKSWSSLHKATDKGQVDIARDLLAHPKIDVNLATDLGDTALHLAAYNGDLACLEVLLSHSALEVNRTNVVSRTSSLLSSPLYYRHNMRCCYLRWFEHKSDAWYFPLLFLVWRTIMSLGWPDSARHSLPWLLCL